MIRVQDSLAAPRRRTLLIGAFGLGAAALAASLAGPAGAAQKKLSQSAAAYQPRPKGQQRCNACNQWQPPNGCKTVDGTIDPLGWCNLFASKF
ncbi:MAG TPA: hypothetical protein VG248_03860 [Caulobacteraceae bacterium]|jgi:hypothetical protein|nr:hypothetical protein [Caulobacteraceae bacterium]